MRIRLRGPSGASTIILDNDATVRDLRSAITEKTNLVKYDIKHGYPPKPLHLGEDAALLSSLEVRLDGEQLTIAAQDGQASVKGVAQKSAGTTEVISTAVPPQTDNDLQTASTVSFAGMASPKVPTPAGDLKSKSTAPVSLKRKDKPMEVPELPLPSRGATMGMKKLKYSQFSRC
jgi:ubiquitin thioesterase OTU1